MSPDQKGIETPIASVMYIIVVFTMSPDQKGIETIYIRIAPFFLSVHNEPRSKGD